MPKIKKESKLFSLEPNFKTVLVSKEKENSPFIETFVQEPENIEQKSLGTIAGIFEISDNSEESSYIVNYLISVVKKEFFSKPKRPTLESFEASLHKANLAISKLVSHGNVAWIGKLNAVCAVFEKNNVHFSRTGKASVFLVRKENMSDIAGDQENQQESNPLKTFAEVSSGRLEENDKVIALTESVFEIFSFEEIKKSALRFSREEFVRFLNTAIVNELEQAATLIVDISKKEDSPPDPNPAQEEPSYDSVNFFSQRTFKEKNRKKQAPEIKNPLRENAQRERMFKEIKEEEQKIRGDFVDKKTGHIYIKETETAPEEKTPFWEKVANAKKRIPPPAKQSEDLEKRKPRIAGKLAADFKLKERLLRKKEILREKMLSPEERRRKILDRKEKIKSFFKKKIAPASKKAWWKTKILFEKSRFWISQKFFPFLKNIALEIKVTVSSLSKKIKSKEFLEKRNSYTSKSSVLGNQKGFSFGEFSKKSGIAGEKLKILATSLRSFLANSVKKTYLGLFLLAILAIPLFLIVRGKEKNEEAPQETSATIPAESSEDFSFNEPFAKNIDLIESVYSGEKIISLFILNGEVLVLEENKIASSGNESWETSLPPEFKPVSVSAMDDLNLAFVLGEKNRTLSFSPILKKFEEISLNNPSSKEPVFSGVYSTYLYTLDAENNQIYRYPRVEGGFGPKTDWLRESADLSAITDMAVSDNIYLSKENELDKFFQGKKTDFQVGKTAEKITFNRIFAKENFKGVYTLDRNRQRIVRFSETGEIVSQFFHDDLAEAEGICVNEDENLIYFFNSSEAKSFKMN